MQSFERIEKRTDEQISVIELRRLLVDLKEKKPDVCFRYRLIGEMWAPYFMSIAAITEKGVVLKDNAKNNITAISNLTDIIQFEIDEPFQGFKPYFHYEINPSLDF